MSTFNEYMRKNIACKIRELRINAGYTQEELSELLNKNSKYIGHIERGERQISIVGLCEIMEFFKTQPKDFYSFNTEYKW